MTAKMARPAPVITDDNEVFWKAADERRLAAQRCRGCSVLRHPPRPMCPHCQSLEWEDTTLSGRGTVYSYARLHHPQHPAFDYPVNAVLVDLEEGVRVLSNLIDADESELRIGLPVTVDFLAVGDGQLIPVFRPAAPKTDSVLR